MSLRLRLRQLHLALGLTAGAVVAFVGLSGASVAFRAEIDRALNPGLYYGSERAAPVGVGEVLEAATAGRAVRATMVAWPRGPREAFVVDLADGTEVFVDAGTAQVRGSRVGDEAVAARLLALHRTLLAGDAGRQVVAASSLMLLVLLFSGWVMWLPKRLSQLPRRLAIRRGQVAFGLHGTVGVFATATLTLAVLSGTVFTYKQLSIPMLAAVTGSPVVKNDSPAVAPVAGQAPRSPEAAVAAAMAHAPGARLMGLRLPRKPEEAYRVELRAAGDPHPYGRTLVWIDPYTGSVVRALDPQSAPLGWRAYYVWAYPLHTGEWLGTPGRWLMLASALTPALLFGTGLVLWRRKRRAAARVKRVPEAPVPAITGRIS